MTPRPSPSSTPQDEKLIVAVRVRPLNQEEGERILHCIDDKTIVLEDEGDNKTDVLRHRRPSEKHYIYDFAFGEDSTQEEVYVKTTRGLVRDVLLGFNATVFAYGATGAGKTHTMVGTQSSPGIMVRAISDLFSTISTQQDLYNVKLSYLELYNENIRDLLNPSSGFLELREDSGGKQPTVAGLTEVEARTTEEVLGLLLRGNRERTVEPTAANRTSSRSHGLLSVTVTRTVGEEKRLGKLYMLDLAGSERASNTKNRGKRLVEGAHINRSLLALGNVINALSFGPGGRYVNYRDSKLTRLLRQALSGNSRTVMVGHISPGAAHRDETRNTLLYASRASRITNRVEKNEVDVSFQVSQYRSIISDLRGEISRLKGKMVEERPSSAELRGRATGTPVKQLREQIIATFREQMKLRRRLMDIDGHLMSLGVEAERQHQIISQWEARRTKLYSRSSRPGAPPSTAGQGSSGGSEEPGEVSVHQAWSELSYIEREQERYVALRSATLRELDECRQRAVALENNLPEQLDSETEREMLSLLIRVHELEADKVALQGERLVEAHELRRRGDMLQRFHRQQRLTDEIITRQRRLIEEGRLPVTAELQELYTLYQQEIHATTFSSDTAGLPYTAYDTLPPIKESDSLFRRLDTAGTERGFTGGTDRGYTADTERGYNGYTTDRITNTAGSDGERASTGGSNSIGEWDNALPLINNRSSHQSRSRDGKQQRTQHQHQHQQQQREPTPPPVLFPPISKS